MDSVVLFGVLLVIVGLAQAQGQPDDDDYDDHPCQPTVADSCFTDVADDLRFTFDPINNFLQASNDSALEDLCSAWEDSLSCTSDIIDDNCRDEDGRLQFDAWNEGLKKVVEFLCMDERNNLKAIAEAVQCWSILTFLDCVEAKANLVSIASLLKTPIDREECNILQDAISECNIKSSKDQCLHGSIMIMTLKAGSDAFFEHVDCDTPRTSERRGEGELISGVAGNPSLMSILAVGVFTLLTTCILT